MITDVLPEFIPDDVIDGALDDVEDEYASFVEREPALLRGLITAPIGSAVAFLVSHGVVTDTDASSTTQTLVTVGAGLALLAQSALIRRVVTPAWKRFTGRDLPPLD